MYASFIQHVFDIHLRCGIYQRFVPFLILESVPLYGYITMCLSNPLSIDFWFLVFYSSEYSCYKHSSQVFM